MSYEHRRDDIDAGVKELVDTVSDFLKSAGLEGVDDAEGSYNPEFAREDIPEFAMSSPENKVHILDDPEELVPHILDDPENTRDAIIWQEIGEKLLEYRAIEHSPGSSLSDYMRFIEALDELPPELLPGYVSKNEPYEIYVISALMDQRGDTVKSLLENAGGEYQKWNEGYEHLIEPLVELDYTLFNGVRPPRYLEARTRVAKGEKEALEELEDHLYRAASVNEDISSDEIQDTVEYLKQNIGKIKRYNKNANRLERMVKDALDFEIDNEVEFPKTDVNKEVEKEIVNEYFKGTLGEREHREEFLDYVEEEYGETPRKYAENLWWEYRGSEGDDFEKLKSALTLGKRMEFEL